MNSACISPNSSRSLIRLPQAVLVLSFWRLLHECCVRRGFLRRWTVLRLHPQCGAVMSVTDVIGVLSPFSDGFLMLFGAGVALLIVERVIRWFRMAFDERGY